MPHLRITRLLLALVLLPSLVARAEPSPKVRLMRTPGEGIQPQAAVDADGMIHLIYYKGEARAGDVYYTRQTANGFTGPIRVNSTRGTAIAAGTIRGAQLALGKRGRVHVIWNGNNHKTGSPDHSGASLFYTRLTDSQTDFEPQRDLITYAAGLDGGSSIAADAHGNVYAVWHAHPPDAPPGEKGRGVFVRTSSDDGQTFSREEQVNPANTGVCACCGLRAFADETGGLFIFYRAAFDALNRDGILLASRNGAPPFQPIVRHNWKIGSCPMSSAAMSQNTRGPLVAWETAGNVFWTSVPPESLKPQEFVSPQGGGNRKHPVAVANDQGEVLLAWTEGTGWQKGGKLVWQLYSAEGQPLNEKGEADGVPVWSLVTAFPQKDGHFNLVY